MNTSYLLGTGLVVFLVVLACVALLMKLRSTAPTAAPKARVDRLGVDTVSYHVGTLKIDLVRIETILTAAAILLTQLSAFAGAMEHGTANEVTAGLVAVFTAGEKFKDALTNQP